MGVKPRLVRWADPAEASLDAILSWIETEHSEAARALWAKLMQAIEHAAKFPEMAPHLPELGHTYRELLAVRPFRVVYRLEGRELRILAVLRHEQDFDPQRFLDA